MSAPPELTVNLNSNGPGAPPVNLALLNEKEIVLHASLASGGLGHAPSSDKPFSVAVISSNLNTSGQDVNDDVNPLSNNINNPSMTAFS